VIACTTKVGLWFASHQCYARQLDPQPDADDPVWGKKDPADGEIWRCMGYLDAVDHGPAKFFVENDDVPEFFDPEELAYEALDQLVLKAPRLRTAPKKVTYVGVETWLWLPRRTWRVKQKTRQEPGISVVVKVKPRSVLWDMGDGEEVECKGPGYPWVKGMLNTANTGCKYSYTDSVGDQEISATITYRVKWICKGACSSTTGELEDFDGAEVGEASLSVHEFQTLVVVGGRGRR
jgi:hypothetical protein